MTKLLHSRLRGSSLSHSKYILRVELFTACFTTTNLDTTSLQW